MSADTLDTLIDEIERISLKALTDKNLAPEAIFESSKFRKSYRQLAVSHMPAIDRVEEAAHLLTDVVPREGEVPEKFIEALQFLTKTVKREMYKFQRRTPNSGKPLEKPAASRIDALMRWYFEVWSQSPPEIMARKKGSHGRVANVFEEILQVCDERGIIDPVGHIKDTYTFFKEIDPRLVDKKHQWLFDGVKGIVDYQSRYPRIVKFMEDGHNGKTGVSRRLAKKNAGER